MSKKIDTKRPGRAVLIRLPDEYVPIATERARKDRRKLGPYVLKLVMDSLDCD